MVSARVPCQGKPNSCERRRCEQKNFEILAKNSEKGLEISRKRHNIRGKTKVWVITLQEVCFRVKVTKCARKPKFEEIIHFTSACFRRAH